MARDEVLGLGRKERDQRAAQPPTQVICPVCAMRNEASVRFCRNCGLPFGAPRDPVRGTTMRRADLPSDHGSGIAAIVGLLAVVVILAGAGYLVLRGFDVGGSTALTSPTPGASAIAPPPVTPGATGGTAQPTPATQATPTADPGTTPTPRPTRTPRVTAPAATPSPGASGGLIGTGFVCDTDKGSIADPVVGRWRVNGWHWTAQSRWDQLTLNLVRQDGPASHPVEVTLDWMTAAAALSAFGVDTSGSDAALVIRLKGPITVRQPGSDSPGLGALQSVEVQTDATIGVDAVLGVNGGGCARLSAPAWADGTATDAVELLVDIKYH